MPDLPPQVTRWCLVATARPGMVRLGFAVILLAVTGACAVSQRSVRGGRTVVEFPPAPSVPRVVFLGDIGDFGFAGKKASVLERFLFGTRDGSVGMIGKPFGLAAREGTLFVCDTKLQLVHRFDFSDGSYSVFGESGMGRLGKPVAIALDDAGNRFVADVDRGEVVVFSDDDEPLRALRPTGLADFRPVAVACRGEVLLVADRASRHVIAMDPIAGTVLHTFGTQEDVVGRGIPSGLTLDRSGRVLVSDTLNGRINRFRASGDAAGVIGRPGDRAGCFARPKHLTVAPDGILYVVDAGFQRVQMFDEQDRILMLFGGPGDEPGCLTMPGGVAVDGGAVSMFQHWIPPNFAVEYIIFVSDQFGPWGVRIYGFGRPAEP